MGRKRHWAEKEVSTTLRNALSWFEPEAWLVFRHGCEVILEAVYEARLLFSNAGVNRDSTEV